MSLLSITGRDIGYPELFAVFLSLSRKIVPQLGCDLFLSGHFHSVIYCSAI
jgi:hypothetical protein